MKKIYILGSINMDLVINSPREVLQGETIHGNGFMTNGGGKGANQAAACGKLGADIVMGGAVGEDDFGERLLKQLSSYHVDVQHVRKIPQVPTGVAVILVVNGDNRIVLDSGANACVNHQDVDALLSEAKSGDILLTQLENTVDEVGYALKKGKELGMTTILNPAPMDLAIQPYLEYVDFFMPNEHEFFDITGTSDLEEGLRYLTKKGISHVIVTLGSKGYAYYHEKTEIREDCMKVSVVDTTAAGDTFCGAFATRLAMGEEPKKALHYANCAAALTVTKKGAQQAIPTAKEVEENR